MVGGDRADICEVSGSRIRWHEAPPWERVEPAHHLPLASVRKGRFHAALHAARFGLPAVAVLGLVVLLGLVPLGARRVSLFDLPPAGVVALVVAAVAAFVQLPPWLGRRPELVVSPAGLRLRDYPGFAGDLAVRREDVRVVAFDATPQALIQWPQTKLRFPVTGLPPDTTAWLHTAEGSPLPTLRLDDLDLPNLAIVFARPLLTPRRHPLALVSLTRLWRRGGTAVPGVLLKVEHLERAVAAFDRWGVVRDVSLDDVRDLQPTS
jgi:hypothetical protein